MATGPGNTLTLDMAGSEGKILKAAGTLTLNAFGFFQVTGGFAIEQRDQAVTLSAATNAQGVQTAAPTTVNARLLTIGASNVRAFAGINGGTADQVGLELTGANFGLALVSEVAGNGGVVGTPRKWTSLEATAQQVALVGMPEGLTLQANDIKVQINRASQVVPAGAKAAVVDYAAGATAMTVATGPSSGIAFDMPGANGAMLTATGNLTLDAFGFVQVTGGFAVEKRSTTVTLAATRTLPAQSLAVDVLTFGMDNVTVFAGVNGGTADAAGLRIAGIDLALALVTSQAEPGRKWTALQANATSAGFVGLSDLLPTIRNLSVELNQASRANDRVIDFSAAPLTVLIGPGQTVDIDIDGAAGELVRVEGDITLQLFDFAYLSGRIGFEKYSPTAPITLATATGVPQQVTATSMLAITGQGVSVFVGYADGGFDTSKTPDQQAGNLYGFGVSSADFGILIAKAGGQSYTAAKANLAHVALYGFDPNDFELSASDLQLEINRADANGRSIDFVRSFGAGGLVLGSTGAIALDFRGGDRIGVFAREAVLKVSDFLYFRGAIGFQKADFGNTLRAGNNGLTPVLGAKG
ncbi:MAG: hypothetical protein EOP35_22920, partial [Rubrivivax sp.]